MIFEIVPDEKINEQTLAYIGVPSGFASTEQAR